MYLTDLIPIVKELPLPDKWQLLNLLQKEITVAEDISPLEHHKTYPLWTPYATAGTAAALMQAMQAETEDHEP
jgi:hypothetical protein